MGSAIENVTNGAGKIHQFAIEGCMTSAMTSDEACELLQLSATAYAILKLITCHAMTKNEENKLLKMANSRVTKGLGIVDRLQVADQSTSSTPGGL